jgi:membrane protease YdiL (CAAX protease family)
MNLILSSITTTIAHLIVYSIIPFFWWLIRHRKEEGFFKWIGIYKPQLKSKWWVLVVFGFVYCLFYNFNYTRLAGQSTLAFVENISPVSTNVFIGMGAMAILPALIKSFIANGLAEEILFRGFLCKRVCNKFGTFRGVMIQAVLCGLVLDLMYIIVGINAGLWYYTLVFACASVDALLLGFLNEKIFNGSIIPGVLLHGASNFVTSLLIAFL